jgi:hypothetical protein
MAATNPHPLHQLADDRRRDLTAGFERARLRREARASVEGEPAQVPPATTSARRETRNWRSAWFPARSIARS